MSTLHAAPMYGPDTMSWRLNRERVLLLGGPRALLLQLAHPSVAAGVADHSDFAADAFGRLRRTIDVMTQISFAPPERAQRELAALAAVHDRVRGVTTEGSPYSAGEPALQWWVLATLIDTALTVEARYMGRLRPREREQYYDESALIAAAFGIPPQLRPPTYDAFVNYFDHMVEHVTVSDTARTLARSIMRPPIPLVPGPAWDVVQMVTVDLLPGRLRAEYGLRWSGRRKRALRLSQRGARAVLPLVPDVLRTFAGFRDITRDLRLASAA